MGEPSEAYVALGANVGEPASQVMEAARRLAVHDRVALRGASSLWRTSPVGPIVDQPDFINAVVRLKTLLAPQELLALCHAIEDAMGRDRSKEEPLGPRPIDLDLLAYDDLVLEGEDLVLPHPKMAERAFVLEPIREIYPRFVHPVTGFTVGQMIEGLDEGQRAEKIGPLEVRFG